MTTREAKRKREQRQRLKDGKLMLQVEIQDRDTWIEALELGMMFVPGVERRSDRDIRTATERLIAIICRSLRRERAEEALGILTSGASRTGWMQRESQLAQSSRPDELIKRSKRDPRRESPNMEPDRPGNGLWDLNDAIGDIAVINAVDPGGRVGEEDDDDNPETGESRRIRPVIEIDLNDE